MTMRIDSELGFSAEFPDWTIVLDESTAGPGTEQYGLPGNILVTVIKDEQAVQSAPQLSGWAHLMAEFYLQKNGRVLAEGDLQLEGRQSYAVMVAFESEDGEAKSATSVAVLQNGRFLGFLVVRPETDPEAEPRTEDVREIVGAVTVNAAA
ncbi:hypothetical protein [Arthrobacter sp. NPDC090010]|uniref:hypothetical protein n=1 Tax=Arthrobacter sp. NPDC090010 TaxID=3363942 RepID=UPI003817EED1